jgi:hypothetical protein
MQRPVTRALVLSLVLLGGVALFAAPGVDAACGGPFDEQWLDEYDFSQADDIVMGRLIERDTDGHLHFEILVVYRGSAVSPIKADGVVEAGCIGAMPGGRFLFVSGDRGFGRYDLIFAHVPDYGWMVHGPDGFRSLDSLLSLVGVLPDTSTQQTTGGDVGPNFGGVIAAVFVAAALLILHSRMRSTSRGPSDIRRR